MDHLLPYSFPKNYYVTKKQLRYNQSHQTWKESLFFPLDLLKMGQKYSDIVLLRLLCIKKKEPIVLDR